jgi:hypothetical protein
MTAKDLPTVDYLRKRLRYEPDTGKLFWRDCESMPKGWKNRWTGKEAFTAEDCDGYRIGAVNYRTLRAHRVAWAMHFGGWPAGFLDHINGITNNNVIANLRMVTNQENQKNIFMKSHNTSGFTGVYWHKPTQKWQARINVNSRGKSLGLFDTIEEAMAARVAANTIYGYTDRHGT